MNDENIRRDIYIYTHISQKIRTYNVKNNQTVEDFKNM
jgi:hypothetical protein